MRRDCLILFGVLALSAGGARAAQSPQQPLIAGGDGVPVPQRIEFVQPVYPPAALAQGLRGIVILELLIDEQGLVSNVEVVRSVPPFDDAAIDAVRHWRYEPVEIDGRKVSVRLTVPISFLMKLPEVTREDGIPELRSGAVPPVPPGTDREESVVADVTLTAEGEVATAEIVEGSSPWADALISALRTWRFDANDLSAESVLGFRVSARFLPMGDRAPEHVEMKLSGPTHTDVPAAELAVAEAQAAPEAAAPATDAGGAGAPAPPDAAPPDAAPADAAAADEAQPAAAATGDADASAEAEPADAATGGAGTESADAGVAPGPPEIDPDTEVLSGPAVPVAVATPTPEPEEPGVSSVRGVFLDVGVPDLASGRRPVVPPLARMQAVHGSVSVRFAVDAAGQTFVSAVEGPELLRDAARAAVESWNFTRQSAERIYLVAELSYEDADASAVVKRER